MITGKLAKIQASVTVISFVDLVGVLELKVGRSNQGCLAARGLGPVLATWDVRRLRGGSRL